jgi:hypothetical protein
MIEQTNPDTDSEWGRFIRKHGTIFAVFAAAAILAVAGAVYVFVWFTGNAQSTGLVPSASEPVVNEQRTHFYSPRHILGTRLNRHPSSYSSNGRMGMVERYLKSEKPRSGKAPRAQRRRRSNITVAIHRLRHQSLYRWKLAHRHRKLELDYVVGSMITILIWAVAILAIPAVIGIVWWINHETKTTLNLFSFY